jgi:hypothetical protein
VPNYVEPFFGSGAVLLGRPHAPKIETVNDLDGFVCNFWRAIAKDPEAVAAHAEFPIHECDLHARHAYLVGIRDTFTRKLEGDTEFYDAKIAGWWCWGICCWIGGGWCSGKGPWQVVDGQLLNVGGAGRGVKRQLVHLGNAGMGATKKDGDALLEWFAALQARMRRVRVACGDWSRVCGPTPTEKLGVTGVFLDPPYDADCDNPYGMEHVSGAVREWAIANGNNPKLRIALCGYDGEHAMPGEWECLAWKARGGYGSQGSGAGRDNANRERIWFSPHCLNPPDVLFE